MFFWQFNDYTITILYYYFNIYLYITILCRFKRRGELLVRCSVGTSKTIARNPIAKNPGYCQENVVNHVQGKMPVSYFVCTYLKILHLNIKHTYNCTRIWNIWLYYDVKHNIPNISSKTRLQGPISEAG